MNADEMLNSLFKSLEKLHGDFVIKDFAGFLNWEPNLGAALLAYTGHHDPFCTEVKRSADVDAPCVTCSSWHRRCCRKGMPFSRACSLGLQEYSVPIMLNGVSIGSVSVGLYCPDPIDAIRRTESLAELLGLDRERLIDRLLPLMSAQAPSESTKAVFRFVAGMLAEMFQPYSERAVLLQEKDPNTDNGFEVIQNYICNNYTDPNISVNSIAKNCNYSPSYVSHTFSKHIKINLRTYINQLRIVLAKHELTNGNSVTATSTLCGFNDTNYFSTVFRALVGIPPSQWLSYELAQRQRRTVNLPGGEENGKSEHTH